MQLLRRIRMPIHDWLVVLATLACIGIVVFVATGCSTSPVDQVRTRLTCVDYSNAWAREARANGIEAGVAWYLTPDMGGIGHAICWAMEPLTGELVFIEPQGIPHRTRMTADKILGINHWANGPTLGPERMR